MSVYPERRKGRVTGKWIAETDVNGSRVRKRFDTKHEGDVWEGYMKLGQPLEPEKQNVGPTFGEVAEEMRRSKPTIGVDRSSLKRLEFVVEIIGPGTLVNEVTTTTLDAMVKKLRQRPGKSGVELSPGTLNRYLSAASSVLEYAKQRGHIAARPNIPWQKEAGKRLWWLPEDKDEALYQALRDLGGEDYAFTAYVLVTTGMRWGELAGLKPEQVEPENGWVRLWKTKNGTARSVPIEPEIGARLKQMLEGGTMPKYSTFRDYLKRAAKSAGLPPEFCIHSLRHTTATRLVKKTVALPIVQKYLGHKSINTTMRYTHVADEDLQNAMKKISPRAG